MTSVKISELPVADALVGDEIAPVVQNGVTKGASASQISAYTSGTGNFLLPVNNLSDVDDPVEAIANLGAAPLDSPELTGNPTAPTPGTSDSDTSIATTAMVQAAIAAALAALIPVGAILDLPGVVTAPAGWVLAINGTIGSATSGATIRANADTANLFAHLWTLANTEAPVSGGRGASAAADFAANKTIGGLDFRGVARATFDSLGGAAASRLTTLFPRTGMIAGAQTHALTTAELATHGHSVNDPGHNHSVTGGANPASGAARPTNGDGTNPTPFNVNSNTTGITIQNTGSGTAHNNVQSTRTVTTIIKL